jgi:hypothetical protein
VYAIKNEGTGWTWKNAQPKDSRNRQPIDYLMKYLGKGVRVSQGHGMYWAINKRFFTNSQALQHDDDIPKELIKMPVFYDFLGTVKGDQIPSWLIQDPSRGRGRWVAGGGGGGISDPLGWGNREPGGIPA